MILTRFDVPPPQPVQLTPFSRNPAQIHAITGTLQRSTLTDPTPIRLSLIALDFAGATSPAP